MKRAVLSLVLTAALSCFAGDVPERCVVSMSVPSYPPLAQQARIEGIVKMRIFVGEKGDVADATAFSGHEMLKRASIENIETWKFTPSPGAKPLELFITYFYSIEGQEVTRWRKCPKVKLDLPTRVEITVPPLVIETTTTGGT